MDATYRNAICVSVWLGLPPLPDEYTPLLQSSGPTKTLEVDPIDWELWLPDLANRPYWSRFWVIQEFLLGINVELYCSNSKMDWSDFRDMVCRVAGVNPYGDRSIRRGTVDSYRALPLVMGRHPDKHPEVLQPLHDLLVAHHRAICKDPRDSVFALLGLITQEERNFLSRLFPNYSITEDQMIAITLAHIQWFNVCNGKGMIDIDSEVFLALRVESRARRKSLLRQVRRINYIDAETIDDVLSYLELDEELIAPDEDALESARKDPVCLGRNSKRRILKIALNLACVVGITLWMCNTHSRSSPIAS
ncbi:hypothetical protein GGS26DRAFT_576251 [Hypomontagnella submonticulosa]|nr:hypothetical protein GGS26DRAFT_576251 [Hypomontagnella submonticulosa]